MKQITEVTILLPEAEAKKWLLFQQHYDMFAILNDSKVFDIRNGSATLHFDALGNLQSVNRSDILWSKRFDTLNR